ncbi:MAG: phage terminase large subunit [Oscillospiraceae bacterium]|nr:phage terminase large subunit [Candidatus Equicaccousia limihippi]
MAISFVHWAMRYFDGQNFAFCSKTVKTCERNVVIPLLSSADITGFFDLTYKRTDGTLIIKSGGHKNTFYLFGGKDESSFSLIQGITLAGVMFDETTLLPKNFVNQAIARTLSVKNAKLWFNCNPEGPEHWFYNEWLKDSEGANLKNTLHLHFNMDDNPILSDAQI